MGAHLKRISMIPKRIHYCWFGGKEKPKSVKKCIESWKKNAKGYEIIEWNEDNFDIMKKPENTSQLYREDLNLYLLLSMVHG